VTREELFEDFDGEDDGSAGEVEVADGEAFCEAVLETFHLDSVVGVDADEDAVGDGAFGVGSALGGGVGLRDVIGRDDLLGGGSVGIGRGEVDGGDVSGFGGRELHETGDVDVGGAGGDAGVLEDAGEGGAPDGDGVFV
jgi:hypothetical protein